MAKSKQSDLIKKLEKASGMTAEEAKKQLLNEVRTEITSDVAKQIRSAKERVEQEAGAQAKEILIEQIAYNIALSLELNPDAFLMAIAVGASCAFLTPIGHQNNALIMGPGGYKFRDYWRMGLPLEIVIVTVSLPLLLIFWPL